MLFSFHISGVMVSSKRSVLKTWHSPRETADQDQLNKSDEMSESEGNSFPDCEPAHTGSCDSPEASCEDKERQGSAVEQQGDTADGRNVCHSTDDDGREDIKSEIQSIDPISSNGGHPVQDEITSPKTCPSLVNRHSFQDGEEMENTEKTDDYECVAGIRHPSQDGEETASVEESTDDYEQVVRFPSPLPRHSMDGIDDYDSPSVTKSHNKALDQRHPLRELPSYNNKDASQIYVDKTRVSRKYAKYKPYYRPVQETSVRASNTSSNTYRAHYDLPVLPAMSQYEGMRLPVVSEVMSQHPALFAALDRDPVVSPNSYLDELRWYKHMSYAGGAGERLHQLCRPQSQDMEKYSRNGWSNQAIFGDNYSTESPHKTPPSTLSYAISIVDSMHGGAGTASGDCGRSGSENTPIASDKPMASARQPLEDQWAPLTAVSDAENWVESHKDDRSQQNSLCDKSGDYGDPRTKEEHGDHRTEECGDHRTEVYVDHRTKGEHGDHRTEECDDHRTEEYGDHKTEIFGDHRTKGEHGDQRTEECGEHRTEEYGDHRTEEYGEHKTKGYDDQIIKGHGDHITDMYSDHKTREEYGDHRSNEYGDHKTRQRGDHRTLNIRSLQSFQNTDHTERILDQTPRTVRVCDVINDIIHNALKTSHHTGKRRMLAPTSNDNKNSNKHLQNSSSASQGISIESSVFPGRLSDICVSPEMSSEAPMSEYVDTESHTIRWSTTMSEDGRPELIKSGTMTSGKIDETGKQNEGDMMESNDTNGGLAIVPPFRWHIPCDCGNCENCRWHCKHSSEGVGYVKSEYRDINFNLEDFEGDKESSVEDDNSAQWQILEGNESTLTCGDAAGRDDDGPPPETAQDDAIEENSIHDHDQAVHRDTVSSPSIAKGKGRKAVGLHLTSDGWTSPLVSATVMEAETKGMNDHTVHVVNMETEGSVGDLQPVESISAQPVDNIDTEISVPTIASLSSVDTECGESYTHKKPCLSTGKIDVDIPDESTSNSNSIVDNVLADCMDTSEDHWDKYSVFNVTQQLREKKNHAVNINSKIDVNSMQQVLGDATEENIAPLLRVSYAAVSEKGPSKYTAVYQNRAGFAPMPATSGKYRPLSGVLRHIDIDPCPSVRHTPGMMPDNTPLVQSARGIEPSSLFEHELANVAGSPSHHPFRCILCGGLPYRNRAGLLMHLRARHWGKRTGKCEFCQATFQGNGDLQIHVYQCHTGGSGLISCHICECRFASRRKWKAHMTSHYRSKYFAGIWLCPVTGCYALYTEASRFKLHLAGCHGVRWREASSFVKWRYLGLDKASSNDEMTSKSNAGTDNKDKTLKSGKFEECSMEEDRYNASSYIPILSTRCMHEENFTCKKCKFTCALKIDMFVHVTETHLARD